ncbi:MAG: DUF934 domain-containing protein [Pseudomonadales bacterium]
MPMLLNLRDDLLQTIDEDDWVAAEQQAVGNGHARSSARLHAPLAQFDPDQHQGLLLAVDSEPPMPLPKVNLIAIEFPAFNDGRGLSLAVLLRSRYEFLGELRAVGETHPDLLHYMRRCGFDSVLLPNPHSIASAQAAFDPYTDYYQASVSNPEPAFRRMRRGA